jgi:hypothetical protein
LRHLHEDPEELAALAVLDGFGRLDSPDETSVPEPGDEVEEVLRRLYTETTALLPYALAPVPPPAALRGRLLTAILGDATQAVEDLVPPLPTPARGAGGSPLRFAAERRAHAARRPRWPALLAAAAAVIGVAGLGLWARRRSVRDFSRGPGAARADRARHPHRLDRALRRPSPAVALRRGVDDPGDQAADPSRRRGGGARELRGRPLPRGLARGAGAARHRLGEAAPETAPWLVVVFEELHGRHPDGGKRKNYYVKESVGIACGLFIAALHDMGLATLTHTPRRCASSPHPRPPGEREAVHPLPRRLPGRRRDGARPRAQGPRRGGDSTAVARLPGP